MIRKLRNISLADCLTLLYIYTLFLLIEFSLRFLSFSTVLKLISFKNPPYQRETKRSATFAEGETSGLKQPMTGSGAYSQRDLYLVAVASRHNFLKIKCLSRSLVLFHLLRRRGAVPVLHIGVQNVDIFGAHAWVEVESRPILDSESGISGFSCILELT
jgi:hypothetical protein